MAEASELKAINSICAEVDDSQHQVILTTECIKAQAFIVDKLKKQAQRNKEKCEYISSANMKLKSEITQAEQEINSFLKSKDTIRMANVELKKELLVAREKRLDVIERLKTGEQKYENMWLECKSRYESLPCVQKLQETTKKENSLKDQITDLDKQAQLIAKEIEAKKKACVKIDRERIIEVAEFMVKDRPKLIQRANEKFKALAELSNELKTLDIETIAEEKAAKKEKVEAVQVTTSTTSDDQNMNVDESILIMPKLQLDSLDLDDLISVKLDEVKMKRVDYTTGLERRESFSKSYFDIGTTIFNRKTDFDETISSYFSKPSDKNKDDYSKSKLINILGDVKIDSNDAMDLISKVNPDTLQPVDSISAGDKPQSHIDTCVQNKVTETIQNEEIEEVDMTSSNKEIVRPPTQFLDESFRSQQSQKSQEVKKTVSFDLSSTSQSNIVLGNTNEDDIVMEKAANVTINSQLSLGDADEGFMKIKDMVLKKHNFDLSPPFVYGKNINLQKKTENVVSSKFFINNDIPADESNDNKKENRSEILADKNDTAKEVPKAIQQNTFSTLMKSKVMELDDEQDMVSSPKKQKIDDDDIFKPDKQFGGYLFRHGPEGVPESLDLSINTTGYEDGDIDFAHGVDSSLLLSPKADVPVGNDNTEVQSQETPNFLSGFRKGLSIFGRPAGDSKAESSASNQGNGGGFNFNFSGEEKKNRSRLFSLFQ